MLPRATALSSPSPASICLPLSSGNKKQRFSCFSVFCSTGIVCIVSCAQCPWLRLYGQKKISDSKNWGHDFVWILQVQFTEDTGQTKSSEKPPAPQSSEAEFCFAFHYFWVGDYPNLHKLVWYSGMTGHVVTSKCSSASCIHWPCSSPAPSVRIASDSKHQPCCFLSLYCCDKNADRPHFFFLPHIPSINTLVGLVPIQELHEILKYIFSLSVKKHIYTQSRGCPAFSSRFLLFSSSFLLLLSWTISIASTIWVEDVLHKPLCHPFCLLLLFFPLPLFPGTLSDPTSFCIWVRLKIQKSQGRTLFW